MVEPVDAIETVTPEEPPVELTLPRRRVWPLLLVVGLLVAGAGAAIYRYLARPLPLRVIVAVDIGGNWWEGSRAAAVVADKLEAELKALGFEPVRAGDPETTQALEESASPVEAARRLRAAFVIGGRLRPAKVELPIEGGYFEMSTGGKVALQHVAESVPFAEEAIDGFAGAKLEQVANKLVAEAIAEQILAVAVEAMLAHPSLREILEGSDARLIDRLAPARSFASLRRRRLDEAAAAYAKLAAARTEGGKVTFASDPAAEHRLIATGPDGVLVSTARVDPWYDRASDKLLRREQLESVEWRGDAGKPPVVLWRGYNAFTYPSAAAGRVALIEDLYGWARALVIVEGGKARRAYVDKERKPSEPKLSPDGRHVVLIDKRCPGCARELSLFDVSHEKATRRLLVARRDHVRLGAFGWLAPDKLLVVLAPSPSGHMFERGKDDAGAPRDKLYLLDLQRDRWQALAEATGATNLGDVAPSPDGRKVAAVVLGKGAIAVIDVASREVQSYPVGGSASAPRFSPDGRRLVFELRTGRYPDIALLDLQSGEVTGLTSNDSPDRLPLFSADGGRVYFEAHSADPVFGRVRAVVRVGWVKAP